MRNPYKTAIKNLGLIYRPILGESSTKTVKGEKLGFLTGIVYLVPDEKLCPLARAAGCLVPCLATAGRGAFNSVQKARKAKTVFFSDQQKSFLVSLAADIHALQQRAIRLGMTPLIRLNGTSDLSWEKYPVRKSSGYYYANIFEAFPNVQFYDYTKVLGRKVKGIKNYHLTFSAADGNDGDVNKAISQGYNIATVFGIKKTVPMPELYLGTPVYNGDESDLRFLDPKGVIVGLYAKGKAKKDTSGFVKYPTISLKLAA
jgi:hypothetical protein